MAKKIIKRADLVAANAITSVTDEAKKLVTELEKILQSQKDILKSNAFKTSEDVKRHKKVTADVNVTTKALLSTRKKLEQSRTKENQELTQSKIKLQEQNKLNKTLAREKLGLISAYEKESRTLNELRKKYKNVALSMGENSQQARKLKAEVVKLDTKLKKVDKSAGQFQRNVGNYPKIFSGAAAAMGAAFLSIGAITRVFGDAIRRTREFEQSNANLASVLGTTSDNIKELTADAKRLGSETSFSASQVSKLQTEFAKLGFNKSEILDATEATLSLAAATGTDLSEAAAIAGATMGGFGLEANQTQRIVDVMAKSFSISALDMEKFKESMKDAAPAAKAVGVSVETTTALLGTLANAGINGSKAGTALKAGFIELNAAGLDLDQGLEQIVNSNDKLATATALVGKRAATSFLVLADGVKTTKELEKGLNNSGGAAKKMADTQLDTLSGSIKILDSAWEGLILGLLEGDGIFSDLSRGLVDFATSLLGVLTPAESLATTFYSQRDALVDLETQINPMLDRYDDLAIKVGKTVEEQEELNILTTDIARIMPNAVTEFDKYGVALGITTVAARKFLQVQKDVLKARNSDAIEEQKDILEDYKEELNRVSLALDKQGDDFVKISFIQTKTGKQIKVITKLTNEEIAARIKRREEIGRGVDAANQEIATLTGEKTAIQIAAEAEAATLKKGEEDAEKAAKAAAARKSKEAEAAKKSAKEIGKINLQEEDDQDDALSIEFGTDTSQMAKEDELRREQLKKEEEESAASLDKMVANREKITEQEYKDEEAALKAKLAKEEEMRLANIDTITSSIGTIGEAMNSASSDRIKQLDEDTRQNDKALETQERRAEQGLKNNAGALRAEQDKLKAGKKREQEEQVRNNKILAYINLASEYAKDDANTAPFKALATIGTMEAITALFEEGTDKGVEADMSGSKVRNTGKDDYLGRTKSGKAFLFDGREKIMGIQHSAALTDYTNQQIVDIVQNSEKGGMMASISLNDSRIVSRLDSLEKSINNSKVSLHIDENAFVTHTQFVNGMKKVSKSKPKRLY